MYLCPHHRLGLKDQEMAAEPFIPISRNLWQALVKRHGGGPVINSLEICPHCRTYILAYNARKQAEFDLVSKYDTKDTGDGKFWYLVDALWVNKWKRYVRADHVTDISDVSSPGRISNARLFDKDNPSRIRDKLKLKVDYIGVNARVWWLFMHVHGGGPVICREELDIDSKEFLPETALQLEELKGRSAVEYARRISHEFVDDCRGDLELYNQKYGVADGGAMQVDDAGKDDMDVSGGDSLEHRVKGLAAEVDEIKRKGSPQMQELEKRVRSTREELQQCQSRQKTLREGSRSAEPGEQLRSEIQEAKTLQQRLDQLDELMIAQQRSEGEQLSAKEEELQRSRLELQKLQESGGE
jgi:hypothetical protein